MPVNPSFKATIAEWRTVLAAAHHYQKHLSNTAEGMEDEDRQLIAYDEIERLDRIIPNLEQQLVHHEEDEASLVH